MAQQIGGSDWINAYLEWTETEPGIAAQLSAGIDAGGDDDIAAVYLEWIDTAPDDAEVAAAALAPELLREAMLLMALRAESECMHIVRQTLDNGHPTSRTLQLAMEAMENVQADVRALSGRIFELHVH